MGQAAGNFANTKVFAVVVVLLILVLATVVAVSLRTRPVTKDGSTRDLLTTDYGRSGEDKAPPKGRLGGGGRLGTASGEDGASRSGRPVNSPEQGPGGAQEIGRQGGRGTVASGGARVAVGIGAGTARESPMLLGNGNVVGAGDSPRQGQGVAAMGSHTSGAQAGAAPHGGTAAAGQHGVQGTDSRAGGVSGEEEFDDGARGLGASLPLGMGLGGLDPGGQEGEIVDDSSPTWDEEDELNSAEEATAATDEENHADELEGEPVDETAAVFAEEESGELGEQGGSESKTEPQERHIIADLVNVPVEIDPFGGELGCKALQPVIPWTSGFVSATGKPEQISISEPGHYILKISGAFKFSTDGFQDGARRWHMPFRPNENYPGELFSEPYCVSCEVDMVENFFSLLISGNSRRPIQECPFEHVYFHHLYVEKPQMIPLMIADKKKEGDPYWDNRGQLTYALFSIASDHWIVQRDSGNLRLGVEVGALLGKGALKFADISFGKYGNSFKIPEYLFSLPEGNSDLLIEIYGIVALSPGREIDFRSKWNYIKKTRDFLHYTPVAFNCDSVEVVADDVWAHRAMVKAVGCPPEVVAKFAIPEKEKHPKAAGTFEMKVYATPTHVTAR